MKGLVCLLQNCLAPLSLCERGLCAWGRGCQIKHLTQKQVILETTFSSACFRAFNRKNGVVCNAQDTPFPITRPEGLLWSGGHMPGWSLTSMLPSSSSPSHITERNHACPSPEHSAQNCDPTLWNVTNISNEITVFVYLSTPSNIALALDLYWSSHERAREAPRAVAFCVICRAAVCMHWRCCATLSVENVGTREKRSGETCTQVSQFCLAPGLQDWKLWQSCTLELFLPHNPPRLYG